MRKVKAKRLKQLAAQLFDPAIPDFTKERIYKQLKELYSAGVLPKDLKIEGLE